jgi:hypothetical protein
MPADTRDGYLASLTHIDSAYGKVIGQVGRGGAFDFPDVHKLTEGLFLSAWTYWEGFMSDLLWLDVATDPRGVLRRDVKRFRLKNSSFRLAERIVNHPDHPDKFVDWSDYNAVVKRANEFLGQPHRFQAPLPQASDIALLKRMRNAISHRSDRAWDSFMSLVSNPPFSLAPRQRRGLTPGRLLYAHQWSGTSVMQHSTQVLRAAAQALVP